MTDLKTEIRKHSKRADLVAGLISRIPRLAKLRVVWVEDVEACIDEASTLQPGKIRSIAKANLKRQEEENEITHDYEGEAWTGYVNGSNDLEREILRALSTPVPQPKHPAWIKIGAGCEMPEERKAVLVFARHYKTTDDREIFLGWYCEDEDGDPEEEWVSDDGILSDVTHWTPTPAPPPVAEVD